KFTTRRRGRRSNEFKRRQCGSLQLRRRFPRRSCYRGATRRAQTAVLGAILLTNGALPPGAPLPPPIPHPGNRSTGRSALPAGGVCAHPRGPVVERPGWGGGGGWGGDGDHLRVGPARTGHRSIFFMMALASVAVALVLVTLVIIFVALVFVV